jgi:hypothetical protein
MFKEQWDKVPKLSANGPHSMQQKGLFSHYSHTQKEIDDKITPLYKLTYKCSFPTYDETLSLYYLYSTINEFEIK